MQEALEAGQTPRSATFTSRNIIPKEMVERGIPPNYTMDHVVEFTKNILFLKTKAPFGERYNQLREMWETRDIPVK